jgi:flagellar hook-associated protein 3 FlgL
MRISTNEFLLGSLNDLLAQQSTANQLNREIATGQTLLDATNDPASAGLAVEVAGQINHLSYDGSNAQSGSQSIQSGLGALQQVATLIDQLRQAAVQGASAGGTSSTQQSLVSVAQNGLQQLIQLANSQDASGRYIFAGSKANAAPFQVGAGGQVVFSGDAGTNVIEVAPSLTVPASVSGQSIFVNIPAGNGGVSVTAAGSNGGTAYAVPQGITSASQVAAERLAGTQYQIDFVSGGSGSSLGYTVTSGTGSPGSTTFSATSGTVASGGFTPGSDLLFGGADVKINGTPAAGDRFTVQTGATTSIFQTVQDLISALQTTTGGQPASSSTQQQLENVISNLDGAQASVLSGEASLGSGLAEIQAVQGQDNTQSTNAQAQLTNLQSANLPQVLARYSESVTALQAAELAFSRIQNLSLFAVIH